MKITTDYSIGDYVYYIKGCTIYRSRVEQINVKVCVSARNSTLRKVVVEYVLTDFTNTTFSEHCLFETKEALIKHIANQ